MVDSKRKPSRSATNTLHPNKRVKVGKKAKGKKAPRTHVSD